MAYHEKIQRNLIQEQILTETDSMEQFLTEANQKHVDVEEVIAAQKGIPAEAIYQAVAKGFGVQYVNLMDVELEPSFIDLLPESIVQTHHVAIFGRDEKTKALSLAMRDPDDIQTIDFIQKKIGHDLAIFYTDTASISNIIKQYHKTLEEEIQTLTEAPLAINSFKGLTELHRITRDIPVVKVVDTLLNFAIYEGASDVHIEPTEKDVVIRYRIDGILYDMLSLPNALQQALIARIKVLANLKIDEHRLPQDGRFMIEPEGKKVAFRVSVLPVYDGEKVVLRLLDESAKVLTFEQLGMQRDRIEVLQRNIKKPHGIILVTGPTGSGKTTTLYSVINVLNTPKVNISTVEDPIEYRIPRVNQSQVSPKIGYTFANGLRSLLRQDPNIIMVGEIRDTETAEIAAHAAMTGHLVLSTLHTNDAVGSIPRLSEMDVPRYLIASTTNLIVAQRLVRMICPDCKTTVPATSGIIEEIEKQFHFNDIMETLIHFGQLEKDTDPNDILFFKGNGCDQCGGRGYRGRIGIYELLEISEAMAQHILNQDSKEQMLETALKEGFMTMAQDGFLKAKQGLTTIDEVLRVTKE